MLIGHKDQKVHKWHATQVNFLHLLEKQILLKTFHKIFQKKKTNKLGRGPEQNSSIYQGMFKIKSSFCFFLENCLEEMIILCLDALRDTKNIEFVLSQMKTQQKTKVTKQIL